MNLLKAAAMGLLLASGFGASALPVQSVSYPSDSPGYVKVVVQPKVGVAAADVLFVVDNSGSMDLHQQNLSANIPALTSELASFVGSVNVGVLTTDMQNSLESGRMQGVPAVLNSGDPGFVALLSQRLLPGVNGDMIERPLAAIMAALSEPLLSTTNAGFMRAGVPLNIVVMTDEDDQSNISDAGFASFLHNLKSPGDLGFFGIIPQSCAWSNGSGSNDGQRLRSVISTLNGESHDLCSSDWGGKLRSIGSSIGRLVMRTVRLPTEPVTRTIEVRYGSQTLVGGDPYGGWIYDRNKVSIVIGEGFDFASEPEGTELEIKFVPKYWQN